MYAFINLKAELLVQILRYDINLNLHCKFRALSKKYQLFPLDLEPPYNIISVPICAIGKSCDTFPLDDPVTHLLYNLPCAVSPKHRNPVDWQSITLPGMRSRVFNRDNRRMYAILNEPFYSAAPSRSRDCLSSLSCEGTRSFPYNPLEG